MDNGSRIGKLKGDLLHWPCTSKDDLTNKIEMYSDIAAREFYESGKKAYFFSATIHGIWRFILTYIIHLGFLDGRNGFIICSTGAHSSYLKYAKLRKLVKSGKE
jgi:hypothetical protein